MIFGDLSAVQALTLVILGALVMLVLLITLDAHQARMLADRGFIEIELEDVVEKPATRFHMLDEGSVEARPMTAEDWKALKLRKFKADALSHYEHNHNGNGNKGA